MRPGRSYIVIAIVLLAGTPATADGNDPTITHDGATGRVVIAGSSRGRAFRLVITTDMLPASAALPARRSGAPLGCDCTWADRANDLRVVRDFQLTWKASTRTVQRRLTDRVVSPDLSSVRAAVSRNGRELFICSYLGDGAGAALAMWSLSLGTAGDWMRGGDLISEWSAPELTSSETCRELGESAWRRRGNRRWPIFISSATVDGP